MANWLDKYEQGGLILNKKTKDNYGKRENANEGRSTAGPGWVGEGTTNRGFNYNGAWGGTMQDGGILGKTFLQPNSPKLPAGPTPGGKKGQTSTELSMSIGGGKGEPAYLIPTFKRGKPLKDPEAEFRQTGEHLGGPFKTWQSAEKFAKERHKYVEQGKPIPAPLRISDEFQMGGSMPGTVGFTYARVAGSAPANGKYTKKTKASAQNGQEMKFYQEGLDFKPKTISKNGSVIKDDMGQWAHPGEITEIGSNDITMQGVDYPVLGISDTGDTQMMYPDQDYKFDGEKVTEFPMAQDGDWLSKYATEPMRQDATRNVVPRKMTDKERLEAVATSDQAQKRALNTTKEVVTERKKNRATKGDLNTPGSWKIEEKARLFPNSVGGVGEMFDEYINPATYVGVLADALGESVAARDPKAVAMSLALAAGTGALGVDPLGSTIKGVKAIPKATRSGLNTIDRTFSPVGKQLAQIEKEGIEKGLSSYEIKKLQMENVGITSDQREAYVPGVSDFLSEYVTPFGYSGMVDGKPVNKLKETLLNIKRGGKQTLSQSHPNYGVLDQQMFPREDAWNLYLGKPQRSSTFRIANTSPVNHPAYTPDQLSNMDIYSLNKMSNTLGIKPRQINTIEDPVAYYAQDFVSSEANQVTKNPIKHNIELLENDIVLDRNVPVMGGYNKRLSGTGLDYNDIWDLEPIITNPITKKPIKVKVDKFIGKPFMSHGVFPEVNRKEVLDNLNDIVDVELKNSLANKRYMLDDIRFEKGKLPLRNSPIADENEFMAIDNFVRATKDVENLTKIKDRLKNIPKKEKGGWLNKYK